MEEKNRGMLYLCATPIGNLSDMTFRAVEVLKSVDLIAAEDTRNSIKLLNHFKIKVPMTSYHEHNKYEKAEELVGMMLGGKNIALITDAGMPAISDPGEVLCAKCHEAGISVTVCPGACALVTALALSGMPSRRFCFEGFLPAEKKDRRVILLELQKEMRTIILYEAPHHLIKTLGDLLSSLGERNITITKELTKRHEKVFKTTFADALAYYSVHEPKGEYVIIIEGKDSDTVKNEESEKWKSISITDHMEFYESQGYDRKEAMKKVSEDRRMPKRDVYSALLTENEESEKKNKRKGQ